MIEYVFYLMCKSLHICCKHYLIQDQEKNTLKQAVSCITFLDFLSIIDISCSHETKASKASTSAVIHEVTALSGGHVYMLAILCYLDTCWKQSTFGRQVSQEKTSSFSCYGKTGVVVKCMQLCSWLLVLTHWGLVTHSFVCGLNHHWLM